MAKFSNSGAATASRKRTPFTSTGRTATYEGGVGFSRDVKSDLFLLAITNMVGEKTYYESAKDRDARFRDLIHKAVAEDAAWVARFIPFLREKMFMRSASTVMAAEYVKAGGPNGRAVVASALQRPDEAAEILAYWIDNMGYGTAGKLPFALKRGVADAVNRMYSERTALKYDGLSRGWRMADVLNVVHAKPKDEKQSALYKFLIDRRFGREIGTDIGELLPMIDANIDLNQLPAEKRHELITGRNGALILKDAGMTWESVSGWIGGPMTAEVWEAIIPSMGYMALLRNLRNFDEAGVSDLVSQNIQRRLTDPEEVTKSKQFPFRFLSAYQYAPSLRWGQALETALDLSTQNIPELGGSTLILTDTSGSMTGFGISEKSKITNAQIAALFAVALAKKGENVQLVQYASTWKQTEIKKSASVLRETERLTRMSGQVGHGTETWRALDATYTGQDRVVIFTDGQCFPYGARRDTVAKGITAPIYAFNLGGYDTSMVENMDGRYEFGGGFSDQTFTMLKLLDTVGHTGWPF